MHFCRPSILQTLLIRVSTDLRCRHFSEKSLFGPVGEALTKHRSFELQEVAAFVALTGDSNPIHTADVTDPIVPGILAASLFPAIIGSTFAGALYAKQELKFHAPVLIGERVTAVVELRRASGTSGQFATKVLKSDGSIAIAGSALAVMPKKQ